MEKAILSTYNHSHVDDISAQETLKKYIKDGDWEESEFSAMTSPLEVSYVVIDAYEVQGNHIEAQFLAHHLACRNETVPVSFM